MDGNLHGAKDIVAEMIRKRADPWWPGEGLDGVYRSSGSWSDKGPCWEGGEIRTGYTSIIIMRRQENILCFTLQKDRMHCFSVPHAETSVVCP